MDLQSVESIGKTEDRMERRRKRRKEDMEGEGERKREREGRRKKKGKKKRCYGFCQISHKLVSLL